MLAWDETHDWVLERIFNDLSRVTIHFRHASPSIAELAAIRRCLPEFRDKAPAAVRAAIGDSGQLSLDTMPSPEARRIIDAAKRQGLQVSAECASFVSFVPFDRTTGCAWLIEDDAEAAAVEQAMLAAGVPVRAVEA